MVFGKKKRIDLNKRIEKLERRERQSRCDHVCVGFGWEDDKRGGYKDCLVCGKILARYSSPEECRDEMVKWLIEQLVDPIAFIVERLVRSQKKSGHEKKAK